MSESRGEWDKSTAEPERWRTEEVNSDRGAATKESPPGKPPLAFSQSHPRQPLGCHYGQTTSVPSLRPPQNPQIAPAIVTLRP